MWVLLCLGYSVSCANNGVEMIMMVQEAFEKGEPYHIVIMDLTVPAGKEGDEVIGELLVIDPEIIAFVTSGYSQDPIMTNHRIMVSEVWCKKPSEWWISARLYRARALIGTKLIADALAAM